MTHSAKVSNTVRKYAPPGASTLKIRSLLTRLYPHGRIEDERRREPRYPYPYAIELLPGDRDSMSVLGEPLFVIGKHMSEHGLGFYHNEPISHRFVVATFGVGIDMDELRMLVELSWCRFTETGFYENGGRLLQEVGQLEANELTGELRCMLGP